MPYARSRRSEERFGRVVGLIQGDCNTSADLWDASNMSRGTVHRIIAELRRRGFSTRSAPEEKNWSYETTLFPQNEEYGVGK